MRVTIHKTHEGNRPTLRIPEMAVLIGEVGDSSVTTSMTGATNTSSIESMTGVIGCVTASMKMSLNSATSWVMGSNNTSDLSLVTGSISTSAHPPGDEV